MLDSQNPFADLDPDKVGDLGGAPAPAKGAANPFAELDPDKVGDLGVESSTGGALVRGAAMGVVPSVAGLAAGAWGGAQLGALGGSVAGPLGSLAGGVIGGLGGAIAGGYAASKAQDAAISALPDDWKDPLEKQLQADQQQHPTASFIGGLLPFVATMKPGAWKGAALPENASAAMRVAKNPLTAHLFGGAIMGGTELGSEWASGQSADWGKVAISTGVGLIFNKPNQLGEKIVAFGEHPFGAAHTLADAQDNKVAGPAITEGVFNGTEQMDPEAEKAAYANKSAELEAAGGTEPKPDLHDLARKMEPDLFNDYDNLAQQRDELRKWIEEANNPPQEKFDALEARKSELESQLAGTKNKAEQRRIRTQLRVDVQGEIDKLNARKEAFAAGEATDTPELAAARQHFLAIDGQMRDMAPDVGAAYRRAAEHGLSETADAEPIPNEAEPQHATVVPEASPAAAGAEPSERPTLVETAAEARSLATQKAFIAADVKRQLIEAGIPADQAEARAQLEASFFATLSAKGQGKFGTAEELYAKHGAVWQRRGAGAEKPIHPGYEPPTALSLPPKPKGRPLTAEEFIQKRGGIQDIGGDLKSLGLKSLKGTRGIISETGMTPDYAREALAEAGYLGADKDRAVHETTLNDLHEALENPRYSIDDQEHIAAWDQYEAAKFNKDRQVMTPKAAHDAILDKVPFSDAHEPDPEIMAAARDMLVYGLEDDPLKAWDRAAYEHEREFMQKAEVSADAAGAREFAQSGKEPVRLSGEGDVDKVKTGSPVTFSYRHNPESATKIFGIPDKDSPYGRGYEPSGRYVSIAEQGETAPKGSKLAYGELTFENPLVVPNDSLKWKQELSERYGGKTGKELSKALIADGYDGVITTEKNHISEVLDLTTFDQSKALYQSALGKIRLAPGQKPLITLFDKANFSTLVHEGAHNYLDILSQYADHPDATDAFKDDWTTIKDWLRVNSADDIKTRHHEQFARGFEQYIREGVAPSKELAGAFARFRNWMLSIYQTLKGLGKPINDDIRGVFDRMLTNEPQRTVIAPERAATGPTLADIHEADANETEPHEAEPAGDRVAAENERAKAEPPQEVAHEIPPALAKVEAERAKQDAGAGGSKNAGSETGGTASGSGEVDGGGVGPGTESASGGMGAGDSAKQRGGDKAVSEGASVSGQQQRSSSADSGPPLEPRPKPLYGPAESKLVDKAGNIRVENLTEKDEVISAIKDSADRNNDFEDVRGGRVTKGMLSDLADDLGLDAKTITEQKLSSMFGEIDKLPQRVLAIRRMIVESGQVVADAAKRVRDEGSNEALAGFAKAVARHDLIQSTLSGVTASWGRTGSTFHNLMEGWDNAQTFNQILKENTGRDLYQIKQLADLVSAYDKPEQVSKIVKDSRDRSFGRMVLEYWINGLISGPATHTTYVLGNMLLSLVKAVPETAAAAGIGSVRSLLGREGERVRFGEVGAQLSESVKALPSALTAAADSGRTGVSTLLPGETPHSAPKVFGMASTLAAATNERATYHDAMGAAMGLLRGARDGFISAGAMSEMGPDAKWFGLDYSGQGAIPDIRVGNANIPLGNVARLPGRGVAVIHSFFRTSNYAMELAAESYRQAANEGLEGNALTQRMEQLRSNPTPEMMEKCRSISTELALMGPGGDLTKNVSKLFNTSVNLPLLGDTQILKFIDPFVHISSNIIEQSLIQRTPLGLLLSPELRADIAGKNGNVSQDKAQAKMLVGSLLAITFGGLASQGYVTGAGPSDPEQARVWRQAGYQPHSVRIGDMWYDVHRLGPVGTLLGMSADLYGVAGKVSDEDYAGAAAHLHHAIIQNILDESFMRGPADLIKAIEDPGRYGDAYVRNFLSSFVPFSVGMGQIARAQDPYSRQARTTIDAMKAKIPGYSQDLLPRRDMWGEPMPNLDALGAKGLTAIYMKQISTDPVNLAMLQLGVTNAPPHRTIRNVELNDAQYDDYSRLAGRIAKANLDRIVPSQQFQGYPPSVKRDLITTVIKKSRENATGMMLAKYPQILQQATSEKIAHKRGDDISPIEQ